MAMPTRENSGLEARVDEKGRIHLFHNGARLPITKVEIDGGGPGDRGVMKVTLLSQFVTFTHGSARDVA